MQAKEGMLFFGIKLFNKTEMKKLKIKSLQPINGETFYSNLAALLESEDEKIVQTSNVGIPEKWPQEIEKNAESDIHTYTR